MNEKFNKNAKVEKWTKKVGRGVRLIVIGPFQLNKSEYVRGKCGKLRISYILLMYCIGVLRHLQRYFSYICDGTDVQAD